MDKKRKLEEIGPSISAAPSLKSTKTEVAATPISSSSTTAAQIKKPMIVQTISSAPVKYAEKKETTTAKTPNLYDHVRDTLPVDRYTSSSAAQLAAEPPKGAPNYVFPHMAPKKSDQQGSYNPRFFRAAASDAWEDPTLSDWDPNDHRLFVGDLGNEVNDEMLMKLFNKYPTYQRARVIRDKRSQKTKGFGFVSFKDPADLVQAIKDMNGKYIGNRPCKLKKSRWKDRLDEERIIKDKNWQLTKKKPGQQTFSSKSSGSSDYTDYSGGGGYGYGDQSYGSSEGYSNNQYY